MSQPSSEKCLNCGGELNGPFCSQCGQAKGARLLPIGTWISNFIESFLSLDSKLLRTLKRVLFQPGKATLDFVEGRRVPYCGPIQTYIIVSALSIAVMSFLGAFSSDSQMLGPGRDFDEKAYQRVQILFPLVNLLSPFLTAILLVLIDRKQFFQFHLAFSLHLWTFFVFAGTLLILLPISGIWVLIAFVALSIWISVYVFLAHKTVYKMGLIQRIFCFVPILLSLPFASIFFMMTLFFLAKLF